MNAFADNEEEDLEEHNQTALLVTFQAIDGRDPQTHRDKKNTETRPDSPLASLHATTWKDRTNTSPNRLLAAVPPASHIAAAVVVLGVSIVLLWPFPGRESDILAAPS